MKNYIFISYAGEDTDIAEQLANKINEKKGEYYYTELVEKIREGDTTFTEKIISYFRKCNIFLVILTKNSLTNQFVNQEWGYAKSLKEKGQIQIIQHITEKYEKKEQIPEDKKEIFDEDGRIKSKGFISSNMEFIDLITKDNNYEPDKMIKEVISLLENKQQKLKPIFTEVGQKIDRYQREILTNLSLINKLKQSKGDLENSLSMDPTQFSYDMAISIVNIGHILDKRFIDYVEASINKIKILNEWKSLTRDWIVSRGNIHGGNVEALYNQLEEVEKILTAIDTEIRLIVTKYQS